MISSAEEGKSNQGFGSKPCRLEKSTDQRVDLRKEVVWMEAQRLDSGAVVPLMEEERVA